MNRLSFFLQEVRYRFFYLIFSFCITFLITYLKSLDLLFLIVQPFFAPKLFIFTDITEALSVTIYVCIFSTLQLLIPFILYQWWSFSIPGFFQKERKNTTRFLVFYCITLLLEGVIIFFVLLPEIFSFFFSFEIKQQLVTIQLEARIKSYIDFTVKFYLYFLFLFQVPLFSFFLLKSQYVKAISFSKYRKYYYFFSLLGVGIISPPDVLYQLTITLLFILFYEIGIWIGFIYEKIKRQSHYYAIA